MPLDKDECELLKAKFVALLEKAESDSPMAKAGGTISAYEYQTIKMTMGIIIERFLKSAAIALKEEGRNDVDVEQRKELIKEFLYSLLDEEISKRTNNDSNHLEFSPERTP